MSVSVIYGMHDLTKLAEDEYVFNIFSLMYHHYKLNGNITMDDVYDICIEVHRGVWAVISTRYLDDTNLVSSIYGLTPHEFWSEVAKDQFDVMFDGLNSLLYTLNEKGHLRKLGLWRIKKNGFRRIECILTDRVGIITMTGVVEDEISRLKKFYSIQRLSNFRIP
jgi:hypothetical protein